MTPRAFCSTMLALCALLSTGAYASAQALDPVAVLQAAGARYRASSAVCADFTQELNNPLLRETHTGRGRVCQKQPNLFMMRFSDPAGDALVSDGQAFWRYTPSTDPKAVIQLPLNRVGAVDWYTEFLLDTSRKYDARLNGQETIAGSSAHRIVLVPKQPASYKEAELWIDARSNLLRRVEMREENGVVRRISLSNIALDAPLPADAFIFKQPPGTQIIRP